MEVVKDANIRGKGRSWVYRSSAPDITRGRCRTAFVKVQKGYYCRTLWSLGRRVPTLLREHRAINALAAMGVPVPEVIEFTVDGDEARLVIAGVDDALPLGEAIHRYPERAEDILCRCAAVIRDLHDHGWNHGALYPVHVLVGPAPAHAITLIDFEKADRSWFHGRDLDRLLRYLTLDSPDLARWFESCYRDRISIRPAGQGAVPLA